MTEIRLFLPKNHVPILVHFLLEVEDISLNVPQTGKMPTSDADADLSLIEVAIVAFSGGIGATLGKTLVESIINKIVDAYKEGASIESISDQNGSIKLDEMSADELRLELEKLLTLKKT